MTAARPPPAAPAREDVPTVRSHPLLFVTLPVADPARSRAFFAQLGYGFLDALGDDASQCLRLGPGACAMLLRRDVFERLHGRSGAPPGTVGAVLGVPAPSREAVDALVDRAVLAGGSDVRREGRGGMYGRSFADLDGHVWEVLWMDPRPVEGGPPAGAGARVDLGAAGAGRRPEEESR